jgi:hypothetical protein
MFSNRHLRDRIEAAVTAVTRAAATAESAYQRRLKQISSEVAAEQTACQRDSALFAVELNQKILNLKRKADQSLAMSRIPYEAEVQQVNLQLAAVEKMAGACIKPWKELENGAYTGATAPPRLARFGELTVQGAFGTIQTPALIPFAGGRNIIIKASGAPAKAKAALAVQSLILRLLIFSPPAKLRLLLMDPVGLGQNLAVFLPNMESLQQKEASALQGVSISDDQFVQQMVGGKVWTESGDIEKRLAEMSAHLEIVVQKYLRNKYETMEDYNRQAGDVEEPYRLLSIVNFPVNFTEPTLKRLVSIALNGPRCGVYSVITWDTEQKPAYGFSPEALESTATVITWDGNRFVWQDADYQDGRLELDVPPSSAPFEGLVHAAWRDSRKASRVIVPFSKIARFDELWRGITLYGIRVPVGQAGAEGRQYFELGQGTAIHALLTGQTGSGKSNLLHMLVCSLALAYCPDELELFLIDFKKGVEFKAYAPSGDGLGALPHARVIAIESEREFGLSCLQGLSREMDRRGDLFRESGCQNITEYRKKTERTLPRILLVVDEFQVFFEEDGDLISEQAKQHLDRLVSQSRAAGIHMILASQTLERARSLPASTMSQMAVRIALKASTEQDSIKMIGNKDAYSLFERQGEAFYNSTNGLPQSNSRFQIPFMAEEERDALLRSLKLQESNRKDVIIFEGNRPARPEDSQYWRNLLGRSSWNESTRGHIMGAALGLPVAIKEPTTAKFHHDPGRNLLVVGREEEACVGMLSAVVCSLAVQLPPEEVQFIIWNLNHAESPHLRLPELLERSLTSHHVRVGRLREIPDMITEVAAIIDQRTAEKTAGRPDIFIIGFGLQRTRDLIPEVSPRIAVSSETKGRAATGNLFARILREGPEVGVFVVGWWDSCASLSKAVGRDLLREFGMRAVLNMSREDSRNLIDEVDAAKLVPHRGLFWDEEDVGRLEKFIPFAPPGQGWLNELSQAFARRQAGNAAAGV